MAFDVLPSDSVASRPELVFDSGKSEDSPVSLNDMRGFQSSQQASIDLLKILPPLLVAENVSDQGQLDDQSKALTGVLNNEMSPAEYMDAFDSFMKEHGDQMFANAESVDPEHPLEAVANSLNEAMKNTPYTFRASESEFGVAISRDGDEAGTASVGPSLGDILAVPEQ